MNPEVRWLTNESMSCFHAAEVLRRTADAAEPRMANAIAEPAVALVNEVVSRGIPEERFWQHVIPLSAGFGGNRQLANMTLRKSGRKTDELATTRLAGRFHELQAAVRREFPTMTDDVTLWGRSLRDQWKRSGTALLHTIGRRIEAEVLPANTEIGLVYPMQQGGGAAHLLYNSVCIEATESDPEPKLPEVIRLVWLMSQLNLEIPMFSESVDPHRLPTVAGLATLPAALTAAEAADLAACDRPNVELALATWMPHFRRGQAFAEQLLKWWELYCSKRPRFSVALGALDQMLHDETL